MGLMALNFRTHVVSEDHVVGSAQSLVIVIWKRRTLMTHLTDVRTAIQRARRAVPMPVCLMQIVPPEALVPDPGIRKALAMMLRESTDSISHSAVVQLGSGFRASIVRSIVTGVTVMSNPGFPHRVFSSIEHACDWMQASHEGMSDRSLSKRAVDYYNHARTLNDRPPTAQSQAAV
jgi:hypothetical protein